MLLMKRKTVFLFRFLYEKIATMAKKEKRGFQIKAMKIINKVGEELNRVVDNKKERVNV